MSMAAVHRDVVPLPELPNGQRARIVRILGDRDMARRLLGLGLRVGSEITVVQQRRRGVVVARAGNRVALGSSVASLLLMQPLDD
ncbi:MAG TPA: ferrous iron transport protein A [Sedimenticola thiotaurini]|uniref:Ferrous iron transport protein A n=1 Tax=Sedimenticola thiotaurini TaxID=1543721 RepID=A0A831W265_9GAMM|nr:ferrous iron transport protein A [Sedimenticola thiotaurini]